MCVCVNPPKFKIKVWCRNKNDTMHVCMCRGEWWPRCCIRNINSGFLACEQTDLACNRLGHGQVIADPANASHATPDPTHTQQNRSSAAHQHHSNTKRLPTNGNGIVEVTSMRTPTAARSTRSGKHISKPEPQYTRKNARRPHNQKKLKQCSMPEI